MSAFVISKTQLNTRNAKVCGSKSAIFHILRYDLCSNNDNSKTVQALTLIWHEADAHHSAQLPDHSASSQLRIYPGQQSHLQHSEAAVRCLGCHFLILYARCRDGALPTCMLTFAFMHHPYLVCILFGMPSLHLFTFLMFFKSCF